MAVSEDDGWPIAYHTGNAKHMHALGVIAVNFNAFENAMFSMFRHHLSRMGVNIQVAWTIYSGLQDSQKVSALKSIFAHHETDADVKDHLIHLQEYFQICSHNRNYLLHARHAGDASADFLYLKKNIRGDWSNYYAFRLPLNKLRQVADDMHAGTQYLFELWSRIGLRDGTLVNVDLVSGRRWREKKMPALPKKPPLPEGLALPKRPRTRLKPPHQP